MNSAFNNATGGARKVNFLPEDTSSPQRAIDQARGKRRLRGSAISRRGYQRAVGESSFSKASSQGGGYPTI